MAIDDKTYTDGVAPAKQAEVQNKTKDELHNAILKSGQSLDLADQDQTWKAMTTSSSTGDYMEEDVSSVPNAYNLKRSDGLIYNALQNGFRIRFKVVNANTGISTISVMNSATKPLKKGDGTSELEANDLVVNSEVEAVYSSSQDIWILRNSSVPYPNAFASPLAITGASESEIKLINQSGGLDQKIWSIRHASNGIFEVFTRNDDNSFGEIGFIINRGTGSTISSIVLPRETIITNNLTVEHTAGRDTTLVLKSTDGVENPRLEHYSQNIRRTQIYYKISAGEIIYEFFNDSGAFDGSGLVINKNSIKSPSVLIESNSAFLDLYKSNAPVNQKRWRFAPYSTGNFAFLSMNDNGTITQKTIFEFFNNANIFKIFSILDATSLVLESTSPSIEIKNTNASANNKIYKQELDTTGKLTLKTLTDAQGVGQDVYSVYRDTTVVKNFKINSSPLTLSNTYPDLIFNTGAQDQNPTASSNLDHIWYNDSTNEYNFVSDSTYHATGNARLRADSIQLKDSNPLNRYKHGYFTPKIKGSVTNQEPTYNVQVGYYLQLGRMIFVEIRLELNSHIPGAINEAVIIELPATLAKGDGSAIANCSYRNAEGILQRGILGEFSGTEIQLAINNSPSVEILEIQNVLPNFELFVSLSYISDYS